MQYRITERGGQTYIVPKVGQSFTDDDRNRIKSVLRANNYFVNVISPGRIAYTKKSASDCPSLLQLLG